MFSIPLSGGGSACTWNGKTAVFVANSSFGFRGGLVVKSVPKGSIWALSISDVENFRTTHATPPTARRAGVMREAVTTPV